ncbi:MAG: 2-dehydro-3-deoxygalactonokinase, partial [Alphaproteobacteria bacterium PA3]
MSHEDNPFIGINWGSSNFRAYLIAQDGSKLDEISSPCGILGLSREDMEAQIVQVTGQWPDARQIYASGMIGSNVGWVEAPYVQCPTSVDALSHQLTKTIMAGHGVAIVPGLTCEDEAG